MSVGRKRPRVDEVISFSQKDQSEVKGPHDDAIVLSLKINTHRVKRVLIDTGSSADILYLPAFRQMGYNPQSLRKIQTPVIGFTGNTLHPKGIMQMKVDFGTAPKVTSVMADFLVVDAPSTYNAILGRDTLNKIGAVISPSYLKLKFHTSEGVGRSADTNKWLGTVIWCRLRGRLRGSTKLKPTDRMISSRHPLGMS